jgi:geranylgeranyl pyrophosphate synthase
MMSVDANLELLFLADLELTLAELLAESSEHHPRLQQAMAHAILGGGKRLRPLLVKAASELGEPPGKDTMLKAAASVELLHGYSLIHDDLPSMDDDDFRRGKPSCHIVFGEAMAILAGDALQALAFETLATALSETGLAEGRKVDLIRRFAVSAGPSQLVGGQAADLEPRLVDDPGEELVWIHERKTAALFRHCLRLGGALGGLDDEILARFEKAAWHLGLAFQATDDVLDRSAELEDLGKTPGKDEALGKLTFAELHGEERARKLAEEHLAKALELLPEGSLADLAMRMVRRHH